MQYFKYCTDSPMNIVFPIGREVIINDKGDLLNVDPPGQ